MISVIVYGRNDVHGYNAHRRVALSLNCLAEVLDDETDEIVFVDYNTPDELPTLIEAIADTLTAHCLSSLRVIRVRASAHMRIYGGRTHLPVVEPLARNVAARRTNPANRWLLSTTTDMILIPTEGQSLSRICGQLDDGFYGIPRFELPEWLWEQLPRTDPRHALTEIERLGRALRLDETTTSHPEMGFDAPGDFQLMLREDFFAVDGFDEAMFLGWHVDTNLSKRLVLRRDSIETLEESLAGYHCNHRRTPTVYHDTNLANDLDRFFHRLGQADIPEQRESWGLAGAELELVSIGEPANVEFTSAVLAATEMRETAPPMRFDATEARFSLEYDSRHVLPFVADALRTAPRGAAIAYIGVNPELEQLLAAVVAHWTDGTLLVPALDDPNDIAAAEEAADVVVVDLGVDAKGFGMPVAQGSGAEFTRARTALVETFEVFRRIVTCEQARLEGASPSRRFVLVNSSTEFWNTFVLANLHCGATTPHSRVRNAVVRPEPDTSEDARGAEKHANRLVRWIARDDSTGGRLVVEQDGMVRVRGLMDYSGFGDGWSYPDWDGIWTMGARSELAVDPGRDARGHCVLTLAFNAIAVPPPAALVVRLVVNDTDVETRTFTRAVPASPSHASRGALGARQRLRGVLAATARHARAAGVPGVDATIAAVRRARGRQPEDPFRWRVGLPESVRYDGTLNIVLALEEPIAWADERHLGLHLRSLKIERDGGT